MNKLMIFERFMTSSTKEKRQREWIKKQRREQLVGTAIVEREIYLKEEIEALEKQQKVEDLSTEDRKRLEKYTKELKGLDLEWWIHVKDEAKNWHNAPKGPIVRQFKVLTDLQPETLVSNCKLKGGCCNYDCGCCQTPRETSRGSLSDHCSVLYCRCCIRRRGCEEVPSNLIDTY